MSSALSSPRAIPAVKLNGTGNVFLLIDERAGERGLDYAALARAWCPKAGGFAVDGLLVVTAPTDPAAVARMRMFNPDGGEAEMCGNGARCVARHLVEDDPGVADTFGLDTLAGYVGARIVARSPEFVVELTFAQPLVEAVDRDLELAGFEPERVRYTAVSVGNPHAVMFVEHAAAVELERLGPRLETDPSFPRGTNVHFAEIRDHHAIRVRHWERGAGATQACGSGAIACAVAAIVRGSCESPVAVQVPGGRLDVTWNGETATLAGTVEREWQRTLPLP
jgi:diaminopimelate epimerase